MNTKENIPIVVSSNAVTAETNNKKISIILPKQLYLEFDDLKE